MKLKPTPFLLAGLLLAGALLSQAGTASALHLRVDLAATGKPISPDLFGIFFEDLNYAADGGLYGELVQNRSFECNATEQRDWNEFTGWTTVTFGGAEGNVAVRSAKPIHPNNPHYISIEVKTPTGAYGIANSGYDGIPLKANEGYELSFFAHQLFMDEAWGPNNDIVGRPMPVTVRLESENGDLLAEASDLVAGRDWVRHVVRLVPGRTEARARVVVLANAKGGIGLDEISLFPDNTFRKRKNGLRADLAQAIAELKPKFIRFPGGCLSHGDGLSNFYRWKDTVGPVELRRGQRNLWGYHQSVGLGYFEYFQFCEDIGAKPLPVLPAGVSCQFSDYSPGHGQQCLPLEAMPGYIQDIIDLIEWANGPATSKWGAVRALAGHPEPFGLKYIGVGNEDGITPGFEERFKMIQDAIRARHPEIVVIGTVGAAPDGPEFDRGWSFARSLGVPMVDEHYYRSPDWFWDNLHRYDGYDRHGPKVYAGEYAAHEKDRRNTLRSALAEAAGCLGFERNGDVVSLASYAPLLSRRGHTQWIPDMIYFNATEVYPSINYQVQRLFCRNSGDSLLTPKVDGVQPNDRIAWSAVRDSASGDVIVKIVNGEDRTFTASIDLSSAPAASRRLIATVLTGANADVANEDGKPPAATPTIDQSTVGATFERIFPANSLTVLRLSKL
jgi:alpha-L-arabinofuranosidase